MPTIQERKFFADPQARLNADDTPTAVGENDWVNLQNCRTGTTDSGRTGTLESIGGTLLKSVVQPSATFLTILSVPDEVNRRIIYFKYCTTGPFHKIVCYSAADDTEYTVLLSTQVTGGLNFSKDIAYHSARIVNNMLYWVEGTINQPRKINIDSGILLNHPSYNSSAQPYTAPLGFDEITVIKPPPQLAPNIQKAFDGAFINNFIATDSFEFAFAYTYYDNEETVVGTYSPASRLNVPSDNYNYIAVQMDSGQSIPNTVKIVSLVVRFGNSNNAKTVKTWDKRIASELAEIQAQNSLSQILTFNFYNNITGPAVPVDYVLKPFDNVPTYAQAMETAKNRLFLGNVISGYDTPQTTSLQVTQNITGISGTTSVVKSLLEVRAKVGVAGPDNDYGYGGWYVYLTSTDISVPGYYLLNGTEKTQILNDSSWTYNPALDPPPTSTSLAGLTFKGASQAEVTAYIATGNTLEGSAFYTRSNLITVTGISSVIDSVMKSRSSYKAGNVFYDFAMRKCGVVTNDGLVININSRNYAYSVATRNLTWSLSNVNAINEIPDWAYYYTPVRTLNLRTRYFIVSFDNETKYATKDADGIYEFTNDAFIPSVVGIGLDTTALVQSGLGYVYAEGDVAVLIDDANNTYELPVIGQNGKYIIVSAQDIGNLSSKKILYEIYTPYQTSDQEPFFEIGQMYKINNPGTAQREYSVTTDVFASDSYTITRNFDTDTYAAEAMSPNDLFYQRWDNDGGKPNFITKLGRTEKPNFIYWSNTYIPGTSVNGLSTFEPLNQTNVPEDCGPIQKLILTSKIQAEGTVMLGVCTVETVSMYLGETQIVDSTGQTQFFSGSTGVIGTINILKGSYGTSNPESVVEFKGNVFWLDVANGKYIQYSVNGLFPISDYKMTRFWKLFSDLYMSMSAAAIEALGGRPFVYSTVDSHHFELLISIPKLSNNPPKGYLLDYPSTIFPFDILDAQGKTIVYKLGKGDQIPHYQGSFSFNPEGFVVLDNDLYAFKNGQLYLHNQSSNTNQFYGIQYQSKIMFVSNQIPNIPKVYNSLAVEANMAPTLTYMYSDYPYVQCSDLMDYQYSQKEGVWYATIMRNKIVPNASGFTTDGLINGEKMRSTALLIELSFSPQQDEFLELKYVTINFDVSRGHRA